MKNRIYTGLVFLFVICLLMCSCSAQWHLRRAISKDPSLSDTTRTISSKQIEIPRANFDINCLDISRQPIELYQPIIDTVDNIIYRDSIRVVFRRVLNNVDSALIRAEVDCPDARIVTVTQKVPVYLKPTFWDILKMGGLPLLIIVCAVLILIFYRR